MVSAQPEIEQKEPPTDMSTAKIRTGQVKGRLQQKLPRKSMVRGS